MAVVGYGVFRCSVDACRATVELRDNAVGRGMSASSKHDSLVEDRRIAARRADRDHRIVALSDQGHSYAEIAEALNAGNERGLTAERVGQIVRAAYLVQFDAGVSV